MKKLQQIRIGMKLFLQHYRLVFIKILQWLQERKTKREIKLLKILIKEAENEERMLEIAEKYTEGFFLCQEKPEEGKTILVTQLKETWEVIYYLDITFVEVNIRNKYYTCVDKKGLYYIIKYIMAW